MSLRVGEYGFSELSKDFKLGLKNYQSLYTGGKALKDFLKTKNYIDDLQSGRTPSKFNPEYWNGEYDFVTMTDVDTLTYTINDEIQEKITEEAIESEKTLIRVPKGNLLISNAMTIGLAFLTNKDIYINQNVFWVKLDNTIANKKFMLWYFNCYVKEVFQKIYSAKYLSKQELSRINIPNIEISVQNKFEKDIEGLEEEIKQLKSNIIPLNEIVNEVFKKYFDYDYNTFEELKNVKRYQSNFYKFGNNIDLRFSSKFHRTTGEFVYSELKKKAHYKIKEIVELPIITGQGISPSDFDENGEFSYVSMADISTWKLDVDNLKNVSNQYVIENKSKKITGKDISVSTLVEKDDIVMMRSGEGGIGKVAIVKDDIKAIFCDFLIRMRLNKEIINPNFAYFYFRTSYFQYLIEINKKGLGNNTNIFPKDINDLPFPNISLEEQENIVRQINIEIEKQEKIQEEIVRKRKEIEKSLFEIIDEIK